MSIMSPTVFWDPRSPEQKKQEQAAAANAQAQASLDQRDANAELMRRMSSPSPAAQQQAAEAAQQQSAVAAAEDRRNRVLFGDKAADRLSLSLPGYMPPTDPRTGLPKYGRGFAFGTPAKGLPVSTLKGKPFWVGESGPELARVKDGKLTVIPNHVIAAAGVKAPQKRQAMAFAEMAGGKGFAAGTDPATRAMMESYQRDSYATGNGPPSEELPANSPERRTMGVPPPAPRAAFPSQGGSQPPPAPVAPRSAFAPQQQAATAGPKWGSSLARDYQPIGHDYSPGGNMEQTETGSFRHAFKPRVTDQRRFLRSREGVAFQMQEQSRDRAFDRHDAARRKDRKTLRQWQQEDNATAKSERDAKDKEEEQGIDSIIRSLAGNESALDPVWKDFVGAAKGTKAKQAALDIAIRHAMDKDAERRSTERDATKRKQDEEDFFSFRDVPGSPNVQMNRRGQMVGKPPPAAPQLTLEEVRKQHGDDVEVDPDNLPPGFRRRPPAAPPKYEKDLDTKKWFYRDPKTGRPIYDDPTTPSYLGTLDPAPAGR